MKPEIRAKSGIYRSSPTQRRPAVLRVARRFRASPERVFHAWLDCAIAGRWLFATATCPIAHVEIDPRIGGRFRFAERRDGAPVIHTGQYLEIVPHTRLAFVLRADPHRRVATRVRVEIAPSDKGAALTLIHEHVPPEYALRTKERWIGILYGLAATLDSDEPSPQPHREGET